VQRGSCFDCALRVLALRGHSVAELRRKLKTKGYEEAEIEGSIARLLELNYLDDARFARGFAESSIRNGRGYGARLKLELSRRGVTGEIVQKRSRRPPRSSERPKRSPAPSSAAIPGSTPLPRATRKDAR